MPDDPSGKPDPANGRRDSLEGLRRLGQRSRNPQEPERRRAGRHARHRARNARRRWPRRVLIIANVASALALIGAGSAYGYVQWRFGQLKRVAITGLHRTGHSTQSPAGPSIPPFTLLVIGSDSRDLGTGGSAAFGSAADNPGQRSDSIVLVRVVPATRSLALLSIPRDTLEPIPGYGTTRINTAFNSGTPSLLVQVIQSDFDIEVNHVVEFNFDTFRTLANAVGGVEQYFPTPARDLYSNLNVPYPGCFNLSGDGALSFVRSRHYQYYLDGSWHDQLYPESDLARIQRQQSFIRDLAKKARKIAPTNILELNSLIGSVTSNLTLDSGFSNSLLLDLAKDFRSANLSTIPSYTYPTVNSTEVYGALDPEVSQGDSVIAQWLNVGQQAAPAPKSGPPTTTTVPAPTTTVVAPDKVSVEVANGSGVGGQASAAGEYLSSLGYHVTVSGDAPNFGSTTSRIDYAPDSKADAEQLDAQLGGGAQLQEVNSLGPSPYNLELVTGSNLSKFLSGASSQPVTGSTTTTTSTIPSPAFVGTSTVNPDSSSIYHGVYIPPGLMPGQTPQTCGE